MPFTDDILHTVELIISIFDVVEKIFGNVEECWLPAIYSFSNYIFKSL